MDNDLLSKAKDAIKRIHGVFGAPGDHGYGTPEGDALFDLYRVELEIANHLQCIQGTDNDPHIQIRD